MKSNPFAALEKSIGHRFKKKKLLTQALTHPSFAHEQEPQTGDNQRLEYLGDAVLGLVVAEHLYRDHPDAAEGEMTKLRSRLANLETLHQIARTLHIGPMVSLGRGELLSGGRERPGILADALEAVIGAVYLDGGLKAAQKVIQRIIVPVLAASVSHPRTSNPKGTLQEWLQANGKLVPEYRVLREEGPPHSRVYDVEVFSGGQSLGRGTGKSKRAAESAAAAAAISAHII